MADAPPQPPSPAWWRRRCLCGAFIQVMTIRRFDIEQFVGDTLQYRLFKDSAMDTQLLGAGVLLGAAVIGFLLVVWIVRFLPKPLLRFLHVGSASMKRALLEGAGLIVATMLFLLLTGTLSAGMQVQFERKSTSRILLSFGTTLTDFDGDGFGLMAQPLDGAPFNEKRPPLRRRLARQRGRREPDRRRPGRARQLRLREVRPREVRTAARRRADRPRELPRG